MEMDFSHLCDEFSTQLVGLCNDVVADSLQPWRFSRGKSIEFLLDSLRSQHWRFCFLFPVQYWNAAQYWLWLQSTYVWMPRGIVFVMCSVNHRRNDTGGYRCLPAMGVTWFDSMCWVIHGVRPQIHYQANADGATRIIFMWINI